jgi:hypothetical protein
MDDFGHSSYRVALHTHPEEAGKLAGMLLEMSSEERRQLLADEDALHNRNNEAVHGE